LEKNLRTMHRQGSKVHILYVLIDIFLIGCSTYLPYIFRYNRSSVAQFPKIEINLILPSLSNYSLMFFFWCVVTILFLANYRLYGTNRKISILGETQLVFKSVLLSSLIVGAVIFFSKMSIFSRVIFADASLSIFATLSLWRGIRRYLVRKLVKAGYNNQNVLIVGAGKVGENLSKEIDKHPCLGLNVVGYLDDSKEKSLNGHSILGKTADFEKIVRQKFIDEVFITIPSERNLISSLMAKARDLEVSIKIIPDLYELEMSEMRIHIIGFLPLMEYYNKGIHGSEFAGKRAIDICLSGLALLLLSPLFLVLAVVIKLTSNGRVFYISKRCGKDNHIFNFYKFRSMVKDADKMLHKLQDKNEMDGPVFKIKNDPRIIRIGKFMRRFSLDELPQLWNVFKGDMSLVGPRPPIPEEVKKYEDWQLKRLNIKPGLVCLWQIRGRNGISFKEWMRLDIWYINNWSAWLDFKILFLTIPSILKGRGAY